ncbi:hypothetical protein [Salinicola peritrichatus]|uniref:hypothetical protein n=1 Tax=Salinicola peritrichatus TaxID=1267424 RepID=UPI000DA1EA7C|nr:hypothetical protein [Salinicola peritrichatus]
MSLERKIMINDYTDELEKLSLASEDLLQAAALFRAVEAMIEKDPFDPAAKRIAKAGRQMAERRSEYFEDEAGALEATISQLEAEEEAESCE